MEGQPLDELAWVKGQLGAAKAALEQIEQRSDFANVPMRDVEGLRQRVEEIHAVARSGLDLLARPMEGGT